MNTERINILKTYQRNFSFSKLIKAQSIISDTYINKETLQTGNRIKRKLKAISNCGTSNITENIHLKNESMDIDINRKDVLHSGFCGNHTLCPICSRIKSDKTRSKYNNEIIRNAKGRNVYLVTFTQKTKTTFVDAYKSIKRSIRKFKKAGQKRSECSSLSESSKITAGLGKYEVKRGRISGLWHVHCHFIIISDTPLDYKDKVHEIVYKRKTVKLSKIGMDWYNASNKESFIIDVKPISFEKLEKSIFEVTKYTAKIADLNEYDILDVLQNGYKKRFFETWGSLRKIGDKKTLDELEEFLKIYYNSNTIVESVYDISKWNDKTYKIDCEIVSRENSGVLRGLSAKKLERREFAVLSNKLRASVAEKMRQVIKENLCDSNLSEIIDNMYTLMYTEIRGIYNKLIGFKADRALCIT
jgi:hypothetical protein